LIVSNSLPPVLLNKCRYALARPIHHLFSVSLKSGIFPTARKVSHVTPIWKSEDRSIVSNYWLISKLSTLPKLFKKLLEPMLSKVFSKVLVNEQHGFQSAKSTITNTLVHYSFLMDVFASGGLVDSIIIQIFKKPLTKKIMAY